MNEKKYRKAIQSFAIGTFVVAALYMAIPGFKMILDELFLLKSNNKEDGAINDFLYQLTTYWILCATAFTFVLWMIFDSLRNRFISNWFSSLFFMPVATCALIGNKSGIILLLTAFLVVTVLVNRVNWDFIMKPQLPNDDLSEENMKRR